MRSRKINEKERKEEREEQGDEGRDGRRKTRKGERMFDEWRHSYSPEHPWRSAEDEYEEEV